MKKVLSLALALMMIVSAFAVFSVSSSAAEPVAVQVKPSPFGQAENFGGMSVFLVSVEAAGTDAHKNYKFISDVKAARLDMSVAVTDITAGKTYFIDGYKFKNSGEIYSSGTTDSHNFFRIAFAEYGIPLDKTHKYDLTLYFYKDGALAYKGSSTDGAFNNFSKLDKILVPAVVPFTHTVMDKVPEAPAAPKNDLLAISPYVWSADKVFGWETAPLVKDGADYTALLIKVSRNGKANFKGDQGYTWKITFTDTATNAAKTVELKAMGKLGWGGDNPDAIYKFLPCIELGENKFVPEVGKDYSIKAEVLKGGKVVAKTTTSSGFKCDAAQTPVVPAEPTLEIEPFQGGSLHGFENWAPGADKAKQTNLLVVAKYTVANLGGADYNWKVTFKAGETTKVVNLKCTSVGTVGGNYMYRFQPCVEAEANRFVPVVGTDYTVQVEVTKGGTLVAKSAAVAGFSTAEAPIVPTTPPVTGDATVYVAVLAVVALFGTAVVVTKKVLA